MPSIKHNRLEPGFGAVVDASGYPVFADGTQGIAHVEAHQALDEGRLEQGHRVLGDWLAHHAGTGSEWIHLHFHMAVFELALGQWDEAYARFLDQILPAAIATDDALTDAPALLWRIALTATDPVALPWQALRDRALASLSRSSDPFVQIHDLLALAGAGDVAAIERFLSGGAAAAGAKAGYLVERTALALHAYAGGRFQEFAHRLGQLMPHLADVGGSAAQRQLFGELWHSWARLAYGAAPPAELSRAA